jgi:NADH-quinone oxidoreductase subunit J
MSAFEMVLDPSFIVFILLASVAIVSAFIIVEHRSLVYAAFFLSVLGITNAVLFVLLGFAFIGLFQIAVYIGAAVTFIMFAITMFEEVPKVERRTRRITVIFVLSAFVLLAGVFGTYFGGALQPSYVSYRELTTLLVQKYWFALLVAALTLVTTLIEAITLARIERRKRWN